MDRQAVPLQMEDMAEPESSVKDARYCGQREQWLREQETLKRSLKLHDDFTWKISANSLSNVDLSLNIESPSEEQSILRYVGGVDLSFSKKDSSMACACTVVIDLATMDVIYEDFDILHLKLPYIPGFLAFRESPVLLKLLRKISLQNPSLYPQVLMVDGNGILHPSGFGIASHLGVLADIPSIGVAKNLHHVDGLVNKEVRMALERNKKSKDMLPLIGKSGQIWGAALSHEGCHKPIFVSIGHRISLETAVKCVQMCCKYRIPEPVRQADLRSRAHLAAKMK